jgi:hypothetical protein
MANHTLAVRLLTVAESNVLHCGADHSPSRIRPFTLPID